ncbi:TPA: hemolysin activation protein [Escherichia coli]|nr:hemolysin activation protein [Escherichia coli]HBA7074502.1 hemolysin activation protein [Escherichia coli]HBA7189396.1 hemolysin activation protein [Escherichia coli]HBA9461829.1 hemolysin activation protein [Escherichia coli]
MILPVFITVMADHDKPQPSGCLLDCFTHYGAISR